MRDIDKTKEQLINELEETRKLAKKLKVSETKCMQVEEVLRESEKDYKGLVENINDGYVVNQGNRIAFVNSTLARMTGYEPDELIGKAIEELVSSEDRDRLLGICSKRFAGLDVPHKYEMRVVRKDGQEVWCQFSFRLAEYKGKPASVGIISDITERKRVEGALRESEETYRALLELGAEVGEAVVMLQDTEQGNAIPMFVNKEWPRITGYSEKELLSMSFFDLVHSKNSNASLERHRRKMRGEAIPGLFEMIIIRKDGTEVPIELTSAYTTYKGKRANVAYIRDITERKKMQEQLIVTDRLASIGELVSGIAHELKNPLNTVIGFSDLLLDEDLPDNVKEDLRVINREAKRTDGVIRNLLTFARKHPQEKQPIDINNTIQKVLELRAYEQKVNNIQVNTQFASALPGIMADAFQLEQVFLNIIINAEYFMIEAHGRGTLTITTERAGDIIQASFADEGPGIAQENLGRLFDPFFTTKEVGIGTGLGLSICHGIIAEHGGRIHAKSKLGDGATFVVELPVSISDKREQLNENS